MALPTTRPLVPTGRMLCTAVDRTGCSRVAIGSAGPEVKETNRRFRAVHRRKEVAAVVSHPSQFLPRLG